MAQDHSIRSLSCAFIIQVRCISCKYQHFNLKISAEICRSHANCQLKPFLVGQPFKFCLLPLHAGNAWSLHPPSSHCHSLHLLHCLDTELVFVSELHWSHKFNIEKERNKFCRKYVHFTFYKFYKFYNSVN